MFFLESIHGSLWKTTNFESDMSETTEDVAPESPEILQTFVWWGHKLAPRHTNVYKIFVTLRSQTFFSFSNLALSNLATLLILRHSF